MEVVAAVIRRSEQPGLQAPQAIASSSDVPSQAPLYVGLHHLYAPLVATAPDGVTRGLARRDRAGVTAGG
jgi:hypothetical protein